MCIQFRTVIKLYTPDRVELLTPLLSQVTHTIGSHCTNDVNCPSFTNVQNASSKASSKALTTWRGSVHHQSGLYNPEWLVVGAPPLPPVCGVVTTPVNRLYVHILKSATPLQVKGRGTCVVRVKCIGVAVQTSFCQGLWLTPEAWGRQSGETQHTPDFTH